MSAVAVGKKIPAFTLPATGGDELGLAAFRGKNLVIYFYPKDNTPGCTTEGQEFSDLHPQFEALNTAVVGVSRDSLRAHENFKAKHGFPFALLSDPEESLCRLFGVIKEKNMYGKKVLGIERSTFLIDADGVLRAEWRKVKAAGHAAEVLAAVRGL